MPKVQAYFEIVNICDRIALSGVEIIAENIRPELVQLNKLLEIDGGTIAEIADANDCGNCSTWTELIKALRHNFIIGERV